MKRIGLIGGVSWNSTIEYYRIINETVANRLKGFHSAHLLLYSVDFEEIIYSQNNEDWKSVAVTLSEAGAALENAGAEFFAICSNTMHWVAGAVAVKLNIPLLHIVDVLGCAARERKLSKLGLLGTKFVMQKGFYRKKLKEDFNINAIVPLENEQDVVNRIIYDELCHGEINDTSRQYCLEIIDSLKRRDAEGIILGCTELPLLIRPADADVQIFDTTKLHAEGIANKALS